MTYYVKVEVRKQFKSREEAETFADKVLESTLGGADYCREIRYVKPTHIPGTMQFNTVVNNPDSVSQVAARIDQVTEHYRQVEHGERA